MLSLATAEKSGSVIFILSYQEIVQPNEKAELEARKAATRK